MFNKIRSLTQEEQGAWYPHRGYTQKKLLEAGVKPGDIICRLGNAYFYGFFHLSRLIAKITHSDYSHAAMVLDITDKDILLADVDFNGLRREFFVDWCDDVRSDNISVLRFTGESDVIDRAVENCRLLVREDPYYECEFDDQRRFACVEFICWCYMRAGVMLIRDTPIRDLPGCTWAYRMLMRMEGINIDQSVWCVGNDKVGLFSSSLLREVVRLTLPPGPRKPIKRRLIVNGA